VDALPSLCVCCGERADQQMLFPRSPASPHPEGMLVSICRECRSLVGWRRFWSVGSMRQFVQWHLAQRHKQLELPASEDVAGLPAEERRAVSGVSRFMGRINARRERRLRYDPTMRKRSI